MKVSGKTGAILKDSRVAAKLGPWRYERAKGQIEFTVNAAVIEKNDFWLRALPLNLELPLVGVHRDFFNIDSFSFSKDGKKVEIQVSIKNAEKKEAEKKGA